MQNNNKQRLLRLISILIKHSDEEHHIKLDEIVDYLNQNGIAIQNRKTIYDDIKQLNEWGLDIEYENGYYLLESPFNLSEIKIIQDSINSLKNLDDKLLDTLNKKLNSFLSTNDEKFLNSMKYTTKHKNKKLIQRMQDILYAIRHNKGLTITKTNNTSEDVFPLYIHRNNDYYYFYYHYQSNEKIYHYRFDNILDLSINDQVSDVNIPHKKVLEHIEASSNSYYKEKAELLLIEVINNSDYINQRIIDDFPNAIKTKDGYSIKVSINNILFSKILSYGKDIKIKNKDISKKYKDYLLGICNIY